MNEMNQDKNDKQNNKKKREPRGYLTIVLLMLCGGIIGGVIGSASYILDFAGHLSALASVASSFIVSRYREIMVVLFIIFGGIDVFFLSNMSRLVRRMRREADDERLDDMEVGLDRRYSLMSMFNLIGYAAAFALFAFRMGTPEETLIDLIFFLVFILVYAGTSMLVVNIYKKYDTRKRGNPGSLNFQKQWLESCDESERLRIYKTGYEVMRVLSTIMIIGFGLSVIITMSYPPAGIAVVITGLMVVALAIVNSVIHIRNNKKGSR